MNRASIPGQVLHPQGGVVVVDHLAREAAAKLMSRQGGRLPNASESQILRELALPALLRKRHAWHL
jgi:hypothetical protein